jgi:hypothetical protein
VSRYNLRLKSLAHIAEKSSKPDSPGYIILNEFVRTETRTGLFGPKKTFVDWRRLFEKTTPRHQIKQAIADLRTNGISVEAESQCGERALHIAAELGDVELSASLITHGANVNVRSRSGARAPLHYAAYSGSRPLVRLLLKRGARTSLDCEAQNGDTPLDIAFKHRHENLIWVLIACGAKTSLEYSYRNLAYLARKPPAWLRNRIVVRPHHAGLVARTLVEHLERMLREAVAEGTDEKNVGLGRDFCRDCEVDFPGELASMAMSRVETWTGPGTSFDIGIWKNCKLCAASLVTGSRELSQSAILRWGIGNFSQKLKIFKFSKSETLRCMPCEGCTPV